MYENKQKKLIPSILYIVINLSQAFSRLYKKNISIYDISLPIDNMWQLAIIRVYSLWYCRWCL